MILSEHSLILAIAIPLLAGFIIPLVSRLGRKIRNSWVVGSLIISLVCISYQFLEVLAKGLQVYTLGATIPSLTSPAGFPVRIILEVDALNGLISFIVVLAALLASIYSWKFIREREEKFYPLFLLLTAGILGMSLTGDFFTLFVFVEITSISSAALISFFRYGESFEAAIKYLVLSAAGGLFLLFGVGILYGEYGFLNMAAIASEISIHYSFLDGAALALFAASLLLKSGSVPVHWLKLDAYQEAPASVIVLCLLSSLTSLYVLFRIAFSVFGLVLTPTFGWVIVALGIGSILVGVLMALPQNNLKRLIAYVAVAEIGYVMLGIGAGLSQMPSLNGFGFAALSGGIFHIVNDILNLGLLFLVAGAIYYSTGGRDINRMGGLAQHSHSLTFLFLIGMLAVSGIPPLNGFASKLLIYESVFFFNPLLSVIGLLGSVLILAIFVKVFASVFLGPPTKKPSKVPFSMILPMLVIASLILFLGLFPHLVLESLVVLASKSLINPSQWIGGVL